MTEIITVFSQYDEDSGHGVQDMGKIPLGNQIETGSKNRVFQLGSVVMKKAAVILAGVTLVLTGCETFGNNSAPAADAVAGYNESGVEPPKELLLETGDAIGDIRFPDGLVVNEKDSIILGAGENTFGKILGTLKTDSDLVVKFFKDNMPGEGWGLISEFQADDTTLVYDKPTRVAVVIVERSNRSTKIRVTVTPRNN
jgi:hypothetical protein